jgi:carboxyl-terminal processing protease
VRVAAIGPKTAEQVKKEVGDLTKGGAAKLIVDVRRTSGGTLEDGLALARLFVNRGVLAVREGRGIERQSIDAASGDGSVSSPAVLLMDTGTSGAAELFAAALSGNQRAELIGTRTIGRVATQTLIKLPDGSGLWLSTTRYLTPAGTPLHEKGLEPVVVVDEPDVEFGQPPPTSDPVLEKAIERLVQKAAA